MTNPIGRLTDGDAGFARRIDRSWGARYGVGLPAAGTEPRPGSDPSY